MIRKLAPSLALACFGLCLLSGCNYLKYSKIQADYRELQRADPSQRNLKHLLDRQNIGLIGEIRDPSGVVPDSAPIAIAAFSSRFKSNELVVANHLVRVDAHFGLDLPPGAYDIVAFADLNGDRLFDQSEAVSRTRLGLNDEAYPSMVVPSHVVELEAPFAIEWDVSLPAPDPIERQNSLFYPVGALRSLDDPIFSKETAILGQYDPAEFLEQFPTTFYAIEEDLGHKVPVVFVHGISGSPREFQWLIDKLDRTRFKPWFYYYPSGADLGQMGRLFHDVFLSGETVALDKSVPIVIVAHSMGGLVVREALNIEAARTTPSSPITFISLASPLGGHPSARMAEVGGGLVLPSWRDLNPDNDFVRDLYREKLPEGAQRHLFFAYSNGPADDFTSGSDGVVPLQSQLHAAARAESHKIWGFPVTHTGILRDSDVAQAITDILATIRIDAPDNHAGYIAMGGFEVEAGTRYSRLEQYYLLHYGHYLTALAQGDIEPANDLQARLVPMLRGETEPDFEAASAWLKYVESRTAASLPDK